LHKEIKDPIVERLNGGDDNMDTRFYTNDKKTQGLLNKIKLSIEVVEKDCIAYSYKLNKEMMKNFEIPGIVDNVAFKTDEEANKHNKYYNLTTLLTENDKEIRADLELFTTKMFKMM